MKIAFMLRSNEVLADGITAPNAPFETMVPLMKEAGYDGVEFMFSDPEKADFTKIFRVCEENDLEIAAFCSGEMYGSEKMTMSNPDKEIREKTLRKMKVLMAAAQDQKIPVNCGRVKGRFCDEQHPADTVKYIVEGMREVALSAPEVPLMIETVCRKYSNIIKTTDEAMALIKEVAVPNVTLMLDNDHMIIEHECFEESFTRAKDVLVHTHICDSDRKMPGQGNYPLADYVNALKKCGFERYISVECLPQKTPKEDMEESIAYVKKLLA